VSGPASGGDGEEEGTGPGGHVLDAALDAANGGPPAHRWTPRAAHTRMGPPPLAEVTAHRVSPSMGRPGSLSAHWHIVTRGLSQLFDTDGDDPEAEGWGFELSLRVAPAEGEPLWAVELLTNLAAYVWEGGHPFADGHHLDLRGPMQLGTDTALTAAATVPDRGIGTLDGAYGPVQVLQVVGLTADELELCRAWNTFAVLDLLGREDPLLVTDLRRRSLLEDPVLAAEADARAEVEGSELAELHVATLNLRRGRFGRGVVLEVGSGTSAALGPALRRQLLGGSGTFTVEGDGASARFVAAATASWHLDGQVLVVEVPEAEVEGLAAMFSGRTGWGRREALAGLRVHVVA
jgi:suppressor of fused-like protein